MEDYVQDNRYLLLIV